jgi:hypothetical protein
MSKSLPQGRGLCGAQECNQSCHLSRALHCPAGQRYIARLVAQRQLVRAQRRVSQLALPLPNAQMRQICKRVKETGLCSSLCSEFGGCFMDYKAVVRDPSEGRRRVFRAQRIRDELVRRRMRRNAEARHRENIEEKGGYICV